jgi:hypothetical protein
MKNLFSLLAFMLIIGTSSVSAESNLNNKETFSLELSEDFTTVSTISVLENQLVSLESQYNVSEDYFGYCRILANKIAGMIDDIADLTDEQEEAISDAITTVCKAFA